MKCELIGLLHEVPVYALSMESDSVHSRCDSTDLFLQFPELFSSSIIRLQYRAVGFELWTTVQECGIDVTPSESVIYCDCLEKAMEYGDWPKVIMGFDSKGLIRTFREVDATIDKEELAELSKTYPAVEKSKDGRKIWLSRLAWDDPRRTSGYEISYAWWIPDSPWESLKLIILADLKEREWDVKPTM